MQGKSIPYRSRVMRSKASEYISYTRGELKVPKSPTNGFRPTTGEFAEDLTDSYETVLLEMTSTAGSWITAGMTGDLPWQMYYAEYTVNAPAGTQSLFLDFGTSGRMRLVEVQGLVMTGLPGDANIDGVVDAEDAAILAAHWQMQSGATWGDGDFNGDYKVDDADATLMATNWGGTGASASVPEPSLAVLLCGAIAVFWFRRR